jgi:hypothetical protein
MSKWYSRPVLFVSDIDRSVDFYVKQFGFTENWRFESAGGKASVAQVARPGIELILTAESPEKMGKGLMFISLDGDDVVDALRAELLFVAKIGFWIGQSADSVPLVRPIRFLRSFSNLRRLRGQNSSDIDQIVGNNAQSNPSFHPIVAAVATPIQAVTSFEHADSPFASGAPSLRPSEPALFL